MIFKNPGKGGKGCETGDRKQKLDIFSKSKLDTVRRRLAITFVRPIVATNSREQLELLKQIMEIHYKADLKSHSNTAMFESQFCGFLTP